MSGDLQRILQKYVSVFSLLTFHAVQFSLESVLAFTPVKALFMAFFIFNAAWSESNFTLKLNLMLVVFSSLASDFKNLCTLSE